MPNTRKSEIVELITGHLYRVELTHDDGSTNATFVGTKGAARGVAYRWRTFGMRPKTPLYDVSLLRRRTV